MTKSNLPVDQKPGTVIRQEGLRWKAHATRRAYSHEQFVAASALLGRAAQGADLERLAAMADAEARAQWEPIETVEVPDNLLTTAGLDRVTKLLIGSAAAGGPYQEADATHSLLGVGDSTTAAAVGDTALGAAAGSTHQYWMPMDSGYPTQANGVLTFKATWASADGNFTAGWQEWGIQITTSTATAGAAAGAGVLLNHKIAALGTKVAGAVWSLTVTITLA